MNAVAADEVLELDLWALFDDLYYEPHPGQEIVHESEARHRVMDAGRRTGKSVIGGHELTHEYMATVPVLDELIDRGIRREFWIVGPEYSDSEKEFRVTWNDFKRLEIPMDRPGSYYNESGDMIISALRGKFLIHAKSAKYPSTLVGEGLSGVVLAEAAKLKQSVWTKYIRPTLADFKGWSIHSSTPEGKNWFYDSWLRGQDPHASEWASWRMPSWVNPYVFPKGASDQGIAALMECLDQGTNDFPDIVYDEVDQEIIEMAKEMSGQKFAQEIGASFTDFVGRVFKDFDEEIHLADLQYDPSLPLYGCCDFGWTNPFVWLAIQVDPFDNINVLAEYRTTHTDIGDIATALNNWPLARHAVALYPDPASPQDAALLGRTLKVPVKGGTGGELKHRLERIRRALKVRPEHAPDGAPDKRPQLLIDRKRCPGLVYEMGEYRYPENKSEIRPNPEDPMDKDDHAPEALGRFFAGYFGPLTGPNEGKARGRVSKANVRR